MLFFAHIERENGSWNQPFSGECTTVVHARPGMPLRRAAIPRHALRLRPALPRFDVRPDLPDIELPSDHLMAAAAGGQLDRLVRLERRPATTSRARSTARTACSGTASSCRRHPVLAARRAPSDTWRHLFTLGYDKPLGFAIESFGRVEFLISPADLQAGRFERACGVFDRY